MMRAVFFALLLTVGTAAAQTSVRCQLREVEGRKGPPAMDPRLADVRGLLASPAFREYPAYSLIATHALTLTSGSPAHGVLSNRHAFDLAFLGRVAGRDGKSRLRLQLEILDADKKPEIKTIFLVHEGGQPFSRVEQKGDRIFVQLVGCDPKLIRRPVLYAAAVLALAASAPWTGGALLRGFAARKLEERLKHAVQVDSCRLGWMRLILTNIDIVGLGHIDRLAVGRRDVEVSRFKLELTREEAQRIMGHGKTASPEAETKKDSPRHIVVGDGELTLEDKARHIRLHVGSLRCDLHGRSGWVKLADIDLKLPFGAGARAAGLDVVLGASTVDALAVRHGQLSLTKGLELTQIDGTVLPELALSGSYGGLAQPLWHANGKFDARARSADVTVEAKEFTLDRVAKLLGKESLILEPEKASVSGRIDVNARKGRVGIDGQAKIRGLDIGNKAIGAKPVRDLAFDARFAGMVLVDEKRLDFLQATLEHRGVKVTLEGSYDGSGEQPRFSARLRVPKLPCQTVLAALPRPLVPAMADFKLTGNFETDLELAIDFAHLDALELGGTVGIDGCKVLEAPADYAAGRLMQPFDHRVEIEPGRELDFSIGPDNPDYTPFAQISPNITNALMTTEDSGFFRHRGFIKSEFRTALIRNLERGTFRVGASSITMQTVKNVLLSREKTLSRKFQELFLTWYLEQNLPKERIFEIYLNAIEFGPGVYGIGRAMRHYFGKTAAQATPREAVFFSSILPSPKRRYVHYCRGQLTDKWELYLNRILRRMHERGRLTEEEYSAAIASKLAFDRAEAKPEKECLENVRRMTTTTPLDQELDVNEPGKPPRGS